MEAVKPLGLSGSAGSTPIRITVKGEPPRIRFGKLYARSHLRADRWYKFGRELLYGRLEDEKPFSTVRRLVQQEDYALSLMQRARPRSTSGSSTTASDHPQALDAGLAHHDIKPINTGNPGCTDMEPLWLMASRSPLPPRCHASRSCRSAGVSPTWPSTAAVR